MSNKFTAAAMRKIAKSGKDPAVEKMIAEEWKELQENIMALAEKGGRSISFGKRKIFKVNADRLMLEGGI